jgi:hypothetical protein
MFASLGIFMLLGGIFLMNFNFYLGLICIATGALLAAWFKGDFITKCIQWSVAKGEENKRKRTQKKLLNHRKH